jgi:hypothetical protein
LGFDEIAFWLHREKVLFWWKLWSSKLWFLLRVIYLVWKLMYGGHISIIAEHLSQGRLGSRLLVEVKFLLDRFVPELLESLLHLEGVCCHLAKVCLMLVNTV